MANAVEPEVRSGNGYDEEEAKRLKQQARAEHQRQEQALNLQRENILSQRTSNPARRAALAAALEQIESQIRELH